jgi:hypothetical protein
LKDCEGKKGAVTYFLKLYNGESQDINIKFKWREAQPERYISELDFGYTEVT